MTATGVWVVGCLDWNWIVESVHPTELEALRIINGRGYGEAFFVPFGTEIAEAAASRREPEPTQPAGPETTAEPQEVEA